MDKHNLLVLPPSISRPMIENLARRVRCEVVEVAPNTFEFRLQPRFKEKIPSDVTIVNLPELDASRHGKNCECVICQYIAKGR